MLSCAHRFFPPTSFHLLLRACCLSLINLHHHLVNCVTFSSCVLGACSGEWKEKCAFTRPGSHSFFFHALSFLHLKSLPFARSNDGLPERIYKPERGSEWKTRSIPKLARRNRKPPSTCLRKWNQRRLWNEPRTLLLLHILHLWPLATWIFTVKEVTVIHW